MDIQMLNQLIYPQKEGGGSGGVGLWPTGGK